MTSWTNRTIGDVGAEINREEVGSITCLCDAQATTETIRGYSFCTVCPEEVDERIYYCSGNECSAMCNIKHRRRGHNPQLQYLSITNVNTMQNHSSKLLVKYNDYTTQTIVDGQTKVVGTLVKTYGAVHSLVRLGCESFIQYQAVFVAAGSKTAIKFTSKMGMDMSKQILKKTLHGAAGIQAVYCAIEIGSACSLWYRGYISGQELIRRCGKSVVSNTAAFAGGYVGFKVGAAIGTWFGPGIGTIVGGIIGSVLGSLAGQFMSEEVFDKYFEEEKKLDPKKELQSALEWFHLEEIDMKDPNKWNEKYITKRYRQLAKMHHPDKNRGESCKFIATTKHFGVLLGELDRKNKSDENKKQERIREIQF